MMLKGGNAPLQQKQNTNKDGSGKKQLNSNVHDVNKRSNRDLHMLDPTLTIFQKKGPKKSIQNEQKFNPDSSLNVQFAPDPDSYEHQIHKEIEQASRSVSKSSQREMGQSSVQWKVLGQNQPDLMNYQDAKNRESDFNTGSNGFTLQREQENSNNPPRTSSSQVRSVGRSSGGGDQNTVESVKSNNLPTILKNVKNQMTNIHMRRDSQQQQQQAQTNYGVVGRQMSPQKPQVENKIKSRRQSNTRDASIQYSDDQNSGSREQTSKSKVSGTTATFMPQVRTNPNKTGFPPPGATLMPIVI